VNTKSSSIIWLLLGLAAVFVVVWGIRGMAFILAPLAMAMVITIAMIPLPGWLKQRKVPGGVSVILTILVVIAVMIGVVLIVVFSVGKLAATLPTYTAYAAQQQAAVLSTASSTTSAVDQAVSALQGMVSPQLLNQIAVATVGFAAKAVAQVFIVMFIFAFMLTGALSLERSKQSDLGLSSPMVGRVAEYTTEVHSYTYTGLTQSIPNMRRTSPVLRSPRLVEAFSLLQAPPRHVRLSSFNHGFHGLARTRLPETLESVKSVEHRTCDHRRWVQVSVAASIHLA